MPSHWLVWCASGSAARWVWFALGRRSHDWINHSKEHCIIGIKGKPLIQQRIDCDVVVRY